jgi:outer membrane receptor protein involved in Fe transport
MKKIGLLLFLLGGFQLVFAQSDFKGKIVGKVIDKNKNQAVEFANVALKKANDTTVIVKGGISDANGQFVLEGIPAGKFNLTVFYVGYRKTTLTNILLNPQLAVVDMGEIALMEDAKQLKEIVVEEKREFIQTTPDGIIITPSANPTQIGGTATDVLQQAPSVQVDANGNVSLRGGNPNIMINGRNSNFGGGGRRGGGGMGGGLEQIAADDIESIEINTNPSARFDADGVGGMINIRLKRDRQLGTHGNINLNMGNRWRFGGGARLNHRTEKWNFFGSFNGRIDTRLSEDVTERLSLYSNLNTPQTIDSSLYLNQTRNFRANRNVLNVRGGVDYYFSEKESLTFEMMLGFREAKNEGALRSRNFDQDNNYINGNNQDNTTRENENSYEFSLNYRKEFAKKRQELMASASTSIGKDKQILDLVNTRVDSEGEEIFSLLKLIQNGNNATQNSITNIQLDYSHPFGKSGLLETGYKGIIRTFNTDVDWERFNRVSNNWERNNFLSNEYCYDENVQAVYLAYKDKIGKFDYSGGVRAEQVWYGGNLNASNQSERFDRQYFNFFPTFRIAYNLKQQGEFIKISYSRRIERPSFFDLNPFRDISNPFNVRTGNTNLQPEIINVVELGYNKFWKKASITPNIFYRYRTNVVQRLTLPDAEDELIFVSRPINLGFSHSFGAELIASAELTKWWNINGSASFFRTVIDAGDDVSPELQNNVQSSVNSWNLRGGFNFTPAKSWRMQLNAFYNSPQAIAQGERLGFYSINFGLNKNLWQNKGGIGFNIRDIFYTMIFGSRSFGESSFTNPQSGETRITKFTQTSSVKRDTRQIMINFRYRF